MAGDFASVVYAHFPATWVTTQPPWCAVTPPHALPLAGPGWKIHVSATLGTAFRVLRTVIPQLAAAGAVWKVAATETHLTTLLSDFVPATQAGKFLTVYAGERECALRLAGQLAKRLDGVQGPVILGEEQLHESAPVYLRYGMVGESTGGLDGVSMSLRPVLPPVPFQVTSLLRAGIALPDAPPSLTEAAALGHLGRFKATGGVVLMRWRSESVVVKVGRKLVTTCPTGPDRADLVAHEFNALSRLDSLNTAPRALALYGDRCAIYLVMELQEATTFARWLRELPTEASADPRGELERTLDDLRAKVSLMRQFGVEHGDLSPANVLVRPDGCVRLVDFELASLDGKQIGVGGTRGFSLGVGANSHASRDDVAVGALYTYAVRQLGARAPRNDGGIR